MKKAKKIYILLGVLVVMILAAVIAGKIELKKEQISNSDEIIIDLTAEEITAVSWEYGSDSFAFHREDGSWIYDGDEAFPVDGDVVDDLLDMFESFGASFAIADATDLSQYGLSSPNCTMILTTDSETITLSIGDYSTMDSLRYVSLGDGTVYLVSTDPLDYLDVELDDFILNDSLPSYSQITKITIAGDETLTIFYDEENENAYTSSDYYYMTVNGVDVPLTTSLVTSYISSLVGVDFTDYVSYNATEDELSAYGFDDPDYVITVTYTAYVTDEDGNYTLEENSFVLTIGRNVAQVAAAEEDDSTSVSAYLRLDDSQLIYNMTTTKYTTLAAASFDAFRHSEVFQADFDDVTAVMITLDGETISFTSEEDEEEGTIFYYGEYEIDLSTFESELTALSASTFSDETATGKLEITIVLSFSDGDSITIKLYRIDSTYCMAVVNGETFAEVLRSDVVDLIEAVNAIIL